MSFESIISNLKLVSSLLPVITATVDQVESLFPEGGKGAQKLELVKSALQQAIAVSDATSTTFDVLWPMIQSTVALIVSLRK